MNKILLQLALLSLFFTNNLYAGNIVQLDSAFVQIEQCNQLGQVCVDIPLNDFPNYQLLLNNEPYNLPIAACDIDTLLVYTYTTLFGQGNSGPYTLTEWIINGDTLSGSFENIPELVALMNQLDPSANWVADTASLFITGGNPSNEYSDMFVVADMNNSTSLIGLNLGLEAQGTILNLPRGLHELIVIDEPNNCRDTFKVTVSCIASETIELDVLVTKSGEICLDMGQLFTEEESVSNICFESNSGAVAFDFNDTTNCVIFTALSEGDEIACYVACDSLGFCDTTNLTIHVQVPDINVGQYLDTIPLGDEAYIVCLDTMELPGNVDTIYNFCAEDSDTIVSFNFVEGEYCLKYQGLNVLGKDSACVVICDDMNFCDTTYICINVVDTTTITKEEVFITIPINFSGTFCIDTTELSGNIVDVINDCPDASGENVVFEIDTDTYCINYTGINIGTDMACIIVTDNFGTTDTTLITVEVLPPQDSSFFDTIFVEQNAVFCVDISELAGEIVSIENICEEFSGQIVNFDINDVTLCVEYTGLAPGTEQACIEICDDLGVCDLTTMTITVLEAGEEGPPIAVDDEAFTDINEAVEIDILANDTIRGELDTLFISKGPSNGIALLQPNNTIIYAPNVDFCGKDTLCYILCNPIACDTAMLVIDIDCFPLEDDEFLIFNGVSPNGDGVNDVFFIKGVENFPNSHLWVYSRWGMLVFETTSYRNGWRGTWNGKLLPDGTYFYIFDSGTGQVAKGYLQIKR